MTKLVFRNVRWINPYRNTDRICDVRIENTRIEEEAGPAHAGERQIDARGLVLCPAFIDMHVHLREPGFEYKETILSGMRAAAHGGFCAVAPMPNTHPVQDDVRTLTYVRSQAEQGPVAVLPVGAITKGLEGRKRTDMARLVEAGACAFSDDGMAVVESSTMLAAMQEAAGLGRIVIDHCEDLSLSARGVMHRGTVSGALGLEGIPRAAEEIMTARDILLAEEYGLAVHIAHVSTKGAVRMIRDAKRRGVAVSAEVTPHHFSLTDECLRSLDANYKVSPPLREETDRQAVLAGIADGTIDLIATDHAPHSLEEKQRALPLAPKGMIGLETCYAAVQTHLVDPGVIDLKRAIDMMTRIPHERFSLPAQLGDPLEAGTNLVLVDPEASWVVERNGFASKACNSPFLGHTLRGKVKMTILDGRIAMQDDTVLF